MNIEELTIKQVREIASMVGQQPAASKASAFKIGEKYFIRMATYHVTGELVEVYEQELVLKNAAWIADSGRFHDALKSSEFKEVEPFVNNCIVNRGGIIDATIIDTLPTKQK